MKLAEHEFFDLMVKDEKLHPDLANCIKVTTNGIPMVHHKLMIAMGVNPNKAAFQNKQYEAIKAQAQKYLTEGEYVSYIWRHERPYRLEAFLEVVQHLTPEQIRDEIPSLWTDSENIFEFLDTWEGLWADMEAPYIEDKKAYEALPDPFRVYRGTNYSSSADGLAWTLNKDKAVWFANRYFQAHIKKKKDEPKARRGKSRHVHRRILLTGLIHKRDVLAYITSRGEFEIVAFPRHVFAKVDISKEMSRKPGRPHKNENRLG